MKCTPQTPNAINLLFQLKDSPSIEDLELPILAVGCFSNNLFTIFYFGQILRTNLLELSDAIYESKWYKHPHYIHRCTSTMIMQAQRPFYLSAFGIMRCNLENFLGVSAVPLRPWSFDDYYFLLNFRYSNRYIRPTCWCKDSGTIKHCWAVGLGMRQKISRRRAPNVFKYFVRFKYMSQQWNLTI